MSVQKVRFSLKISSDEYLKYYRGMARYVTVMTYEGIRVKLPAENLRRFLTYEGICGQFVLCFDERGKMISLEKTAS